MCTEPQEWEWKVLHKPEERRDERHKPSLWRGSGEGSGSACMRDVARQDCRNAANTGSTGGPHAEQKDAVSLSCVSDEDKTSVCYWSKQTNPRESSCSALPSPAHPFPCLGEGLHNLDLPWPQDVRAAETEDTCRRQGHCCGFVAPNRQQLLAYVSQDIPSQ